MDFKVEDIPDDVMKRQNDAKIEEHRVDVNITPGKTLSVYYQEGVPIGPVRSPSILLLHGIKFKSQTWRDLGTIAMSAAAGHRVVAIDLPGYGNTQGDVEDKGGFLKKFVEAVELGQPVVVAPSMSGMFALPYLLANHGPASGFIPVAPVCTEKYTKQQYESLTIPVIVVYGENDALDFCPVATKNLTQTPNHVVQCFKDGNHPCYLDNPVLWHQLVYSFLKMLE